MSETNTESIASPKSLAAENRELRAKLKAAHEMLRAIQFGEVDALVIDNGGAQRVRTLEGADAAYRTIVEVMGQGAATIAADGTILYCNRHFAELLRSPPQQSTGASIYDFVDPDLEASLRALLWEGLGAACVGKALSLRAGDGTPISAVISATPISIDGIACVCLVLTDLTEHEARIAAEAANKAKDRFLAVLSHELRTPLTPVVMVVANLQSDTSLPARVREDLAMVQRNIEMETRLIDDLLDLSRVINGKLRLQAEPVSIKRLVTNVLQMLTSSLNQKSMHVECSWDARRDCVNGDPVRLQQVIWNLLKNAIKFGKDGGKIDVRSINAGDDTIRLEIQDDGMGIDGSSLPNIFNAFEQSNGTSRPQSGGLGLGLAIVKAVVEMHGGTVRAESDGVGRGTTLCVTLPLTSLQEASATQGNLVPDSADPPVRLRVLLVEDHLETATILAKLLREYGHQVTIADTVSAALQQVGAASFDIVVSDIGLPDGTGYDLMTQIKETCGIPGVALTGYGMEDDVRRSSDTGFAEHVVKPVNVSHLQSVMCRVMRRKQTAH